MARSGTARRASTESRSSPAAIRPSFAAPAFPAIPTTATAATSRPRSADLVVASLYLPNGNPVGTEKFDYKLRWMERLGGHAARAARRRAADGACRRLERGARGPRRVLGPGDAARRGDAARERAQPSAGIVHQGWTDALRALHPDEPKLYTFWDYTAGCWQRDAGFRLDHLLCSPEAADRLRGAGVDKWVRARRKPATTRPTWVELA